MGLALRDEKAFGVWIHPDINSDPYSTRATLDGLAALLTTKPKTKNDNGIGIDFYYCHGSDRPWEARLGERLFPFLSHQKAHVQGTR